MSALWFLGPFIVFIMWIDCGEDIADLCRWVRSRLQERRPAASELEEGELWPVKEEGELWPGEHALDRRFDSMLGPVETLPDHQIVAWTPEEREVLGHNETVALISRIDSELKKIEWERIKEGSPWSPDEEAPDLSSLRARSIPLDDIALGSSVTAGRVTISPTGINTSTSFLY